MIIIPIKVTQPSYSRPLVTIFLIVVNVLVFLHEFWLQMLDGGYSLNQFMALYALRPAYLYLHPENLITHMFLHSGWIHVLGNMLFLWVFGDNVEDILGHTKYLLFYLVCGIAAGLAQVLMDPGSSVPMVGASGAIAGVMGAYMVKFPRSQVVMLAWLILFFTFDIPAVFMLLYWFALQLFGGFGSITDSAQGGVAFFAHVGGFVAGAILVNLIGPRGALLAAAGPLLVMKPRVTLYTRAGCCLCDDAKRVLLDARRTADFEYEEFDIDIDPELLHQYNDEVPVIAINRVKAFKYRVDRNEFLKKLAARI